MSSSFLLCMVFLVGSFFPSVLWIPLSLRFLRFVLWTTLELPYVLFPYFFLKLWELCFSLIFNSVIKICLEMVLFELNIMGDLCVLFFWTFILLSNFGKFSAITSLSKFSIPLPFSISSWMSMAHKFALLKLFYKTCNLSSLCFFFFSSSLSVYFQIICLQVHRFFQLLKILVLCSLILFL